MVSTNLSDTETFKSIIRKGFNKGPENELLPKESKDSETLEQLQYVRNNTIESILLYCSHLARILPNIDPELFEKGRDYINQILKYLEDKLYSDASPLNQMDKYSLVRGDVVMAKVIDPYNKDLMKFRRFYSFKDGDLVLCPVHIDYLNEKEVENRKYTPDDTFQSIARIVKCDEYERYLAQVDEIYESHKRAFLEVVGLTME